MMRNFVMALQRELRRIEAGLGECGTQPSCTFIHGLPAKPERFSSGHHRKIVNADRDSRSIHRLRRKCAIGFQPLKIGVAVVSFLIEKRDSERGRELSRVMKLSARVTELSRGFRVERLPIVDQEISSSEGLKKLFLKRLDEPIPRMKIPKNQVLFSLISFRCWLA